MPVSMSQLAVLGRLLAVPTKSSPQVRVKPEMLGMAAWTAGRPARAVTTKERTPILQIFTCTEWNVCTNMRQWKLNGGRTSKK